MHFKQAIKEKLESREKLEIRETKELLAKTEPTVHLEMTALRVQRENKDQRVCLVSRERREPKERKDQKDLKELRVGSTIISDKASNFARIRRP